MKYANQVSEIINAFSPEPLKIEQMTFFYCDDTMEYRTSDKYTSPIEDIFETCTENQEPHAFLLLGHRGCGKSTELNHLSSRLINNGCPVKTIACSLDLDLLNLVYSDLFILMGEALLQIANETNCALNQELTNKINEFWDQATKISISQELAATSVESGLSMKTPKFFANIFELFAEIKANLKFNEETRTEYRKQINIRSSEWLKLLSDVTKEIKNTTNHLPIIILEDLDKLNPENAWNVFYHYAALLSGMPFTVIYTFPIGLSYDTKFSSMEAYFITQTLPMIKIENIDGSPCLGGIEIIERIVKKRADLHLFEEQVLDTLIRLTGGSLRDLFHVINAAAKRANRRKSSTISMEDAARALEELKTTLTKRIEKDDYKFLTNIYCNNKELIENKQALLHMLQASVVLEYNGKRWHNVHPLVIQFLKEQGFLKENP